MVTERPTLETKTEVAGPRNITIEEIEQEIKSRHLTNVTRNHEPVTNKHNRKIENLDFTADDADENDGKQLNIKEDCSEITIQYCKFRGKTTLGQGLNIVGKNTKKITVQYCIFEDFSFSGGTNGGEPLRVGESQYSGCVYECVIKNNIFRNLTSDPECISIKSCKNTIEDNFFIGNRGNVTVRQGGLTNIQHNYFKGNNGVRIHGYGNYVGYNCFEDNDHEDDRSPITVRWGNTDKDKNWETSDTPAAHEGFPTFKAWKKYAQAKHTTIKGNEFKKCKNTVIKLRKQNDEHDINTPPEDPEEDNNERVEEFTFKIQH